MIIYNVRNVVDQKVAELCTLTIGSVFFYETICFRMNYYTKLETYLKSGINMIILFVHLLFFRSPFP